MNTILTMSGIVKTYSMGEEEQTVLDCVDFTIHEGEFVSVLGPSGSGKSTLMNIIGCLDVPTEGDYMLNGSDVSCLDEIELSEVRNREIGFIFQQFQLLPRLNALENVELPLIYAGIPERERRRLAEEMLTKVGLASKMKNKPNQLSGGQQQRVAVARALVTGPTILLADEPTGALDQKTGKQIMELFEQLHNEGKTIVMITHDKEIARYGSRIVNILDGRLTDHEGHTANAVVETAALSSAMEDSGEKDVLDVARTLPTLAENNEALSLLFGAVASFLKDERNIEMTGQMLKQLGEKMGNPATKCEADNIDEANDKGGEPHV